MIRTLKTTFMTNSKLSIKRLRNKKLAQLQRKMSKCKKGSNQWKKYHRAKQFIMSKSGQSRAS